ncbi:MAG: amino acid adenylation domain-containing protein [Desulfobacteraceae bacterium]|nr:amino acid adenylation domain-containing protein [Desulfobacteraceae bacterium]
MSEMYQSSDVKTFFKSPRENRQCLSLSADLTEKFRKLSCNEGTPLFMAVTAAVNILLHRYSTQEDIIASTLTAEQNCPDLAAEMEYFPDNLLLSVDLSGNPNFKELLKRVRAVFLEAYAQHDLPPENLAEALQQEWSINQPAFFQVAFTVKNLPEHILKRSLNQLDVHPGNAKFDLTFELNERQEDIICCIGYRIDLFDETTITRMIGHFKTLLQGIVADPLQRISELPLLTESEQRQLIVEWNDTRTEYPRNKCIHRLFEEQAEQTPDAVAIVFEDKQLTYGELNIRANQLANHIRASGAEPGMPVGIYMEHSLDMIVGMLGTLKAGRAYVPLDSAYPRERIAFILKDVNVSLVLTRERLIKELPECGAKLICLDSDWKKIAEENEENPDNDVKAENLAYIIYTSGSTGKPKGVAVSHRSVNRLLLNTNYVKIESSDRVAQASNASFDAATFEIWGSLLHGARLIGIPRDIILSPQKFATHIREHRISVLFLTTALFNQFARETPRVFNSMRYLLFGGEAVDPQWVRKVLKNCPLLKLVHVYGPTENTTFSLWYPVKDVPEESATIPVGRPISNTQIYLLDQNMNIVPIGIPGELYLGGDGVAQGYLNRPNLTCDKFIPNPFSDKSEDRIYKTGDIGRYLPDGNIEFIGRMDNQVKIRGFRIELGEIEAALLEHPDVLQTIVIMREDLPGDKRLVAYTVPNPERIPEISERRDFLKEILPDYMLPWTFVMLEAMPLTPNGKIDRDNLPMPDVSMADKNYSTPRTPAENRLASVWAKVLRVKQVGIYENFIELGGHSLLAMQVISRVREEFQVELSVGSFFESPTIASMTKHIEILQKESLPQAPGIKSVSRNQEILLSFPQQQLYFLSELHPEQPVYNETCTLRLGSIDIATLERSLNEIIRRHEILRTTFATVDGKPVQIIHSSYSFTLQTQDIRCFSKTERETEALRLAEDELKRPFDLTRAPLMRGTVMQMDDSDYRLFLAIHHLITDGVSVYNIFLPELEAIYDAFSVGKSSPLPELTIQYADFAVWQRQWLQEEILSPHLAYWKKKLANLPELRLPTDRPYSSEMTFQGARQCLALSKELTEKLRLLSRLEDVTLFMTLTAAINVLLQRYSSQEDILIGTFSAGRNTSETEGVMGHFLNTLVLRTNLAGDPVFRELLAHVREVTLEAYEHQYLPFDKLVTALQPERTFGRNPLFQVAFVLEPPLSELNSQWTLSQLDIHSGTAKFDLTFELDERQEGIIGRVEYRTDLFDDATITRMIGHFKTLLEGIVADPLQRISELPLLTQAEQHQLIVKWNDTRAEYPKDKCIHHLFEEHAEQTPDAMAVIFEDRQVTYKELNSLANGLAHYLQSFGVGPEVLVGICVERSVEMIVGLIGILKAGGAYVPVDPAYPEERIAFMLEDADVGILLTQEKFLPRLPDRKMTAICLDRDSRLFGKKYDNPVCHAGADNIAYVIYTSGSTGRPKGVMIEHHSVLNRILWMHERYPLAEKGVILQKTPFTFDVSVWELFWWSFAGASVCMLKPGGEKHPSEIIDAIEAHDVTVIHFVPSMLSAFLSYVKDRACSHRLSSLARVFASGEALNVQQVAAFNSMIYERHGTTLHNLYGPTEATVDVSYFDCSPFTGETVPIGKPIFNTALYILDQKTQPVPIGASGELCIGGVNVGRGYLNRPELTKEKFVPDPFRSFGQMYRTGDLCRFLPDGNIEYMGRMDHQVKIRGFRIELGEIEAVLSGHAAVRESVVIARRSQAGDSRLAAYVVPNQDPDPTANDLGIFLREKLPDYMIPSAFVMLETMPLTSSGKTDRRALPAPDKSSLPIKASFVLPRDALELRLVKIWEDILDIRPIGVKDNFFNLGGHSLLAVSLMACIYQQFGKNLPLATLFRGATIEQLAGIIRQQTDSQPWSPLADIQPNGLKRPFFCIPGAGGNVVYFHELARHLGQDQPFYGLQARGLDGESEPYTRTEEMATHYIEAIKGIQPRGPYLLGGHSSGGSVAFEMTQQLQMQDEEVALLAILDIPAFVPTGKQPDWNDARWITVIAYVIEQLSGKKLDVSYDSLLPLNPHDQLNYLKKQLELISLLPPKAGLNQVRGIVQVIKANELALMNYKAKGGCNGRITLFRTTEVYHDEIGFPIGIPNDPAWGWSRLSSEPVEIHTVSGDHMTMMAEPHVKNLAEQLKVCIDKAKC